MTARSSLRRVALIVFALAGGFAVVRTGIAQAVEQSPVMQAAATRIAPGDANVLTVRARTALLQGYAKDARPPEKRGSPLPLDSRELQRAGRLAHAALERDVTKTEALAIYGAALNAKGQVAAAGSAMRAADSLTKRNLLSRIWLIEDSSKKNDSRRLLHNVDIALRVSASAQDQMFPFLARALQDETMVPEFVDVLRLDPPWIEPFLYTAITSGYATKNLARIYNELGRKYDHQGQELAPLLMQQLVAQQLFPEVFALGKQLKGPNGASIADPAFAKPAGLEPLSWELSSTSNFDAARGTDSFGKTGLAIISSGSGAEVVARELLQLRPGLYRFANSVTSDLGEISLDLEWRLRCATSGVTLGTFNPVKDKAAQWTVPAGCAYQWLELYVDAEAAVGGENVFLTPVSLVQTTAPAA